MSLDFAPLPTRQVAPALSTGAAFAAPRRLQHEPQPVAVVNRLPPFSPRLLRGNTTRNVVEANANGVLLFSKWDPSEVEVKDISLTDYIQVRNPVLLPHTAGRYATKQFRKAQMPIVERLVNR
ncbi:ribosomal protein S5 [Rhodotorula kratochvilovae]